MDLISTKIMDAGVVPVVKLNRPDVDAIPLAQALCQGRLPVAEITFRAAGAERAITGIRQFVPELIVGAGTVLTERQVDEAADAGAQFIVSPGFSGKIVERALKLGLPVFPGCISPTEYQMALEYNFEIVKFFPAEQSGGVSRIKALSAPFSMLKVMPTGGISLKNLAEYLSCPAVCACGGSYMVRPDLIEGGRWEEITELCKNTVRIVRTVRGK